MSRQLRGFKRSAITLDYNLYRVGVPITGVVDDQLSVIDIRPEGVEQTMVLVHGFAGCAETWEHQINHFSHTYHVVAPDLRGHGLSDAPYTEYTMRELVDDLYRIRQELELPEKFILVGHSFGGSVCAEYATAHPEQIEKMILIATAGEYPLPKILQLVFRLPPGLFRPWWKYRPRWNAEVHVMKRMMLNNLNNWDGWSLLKQISVPTMVITGERDNYFPRAVYDYVGKAVPGAEVIDIGTSKHKVQLERHEAVNRSIERFIAGDEQRASWRGTSPESSLVTDRPWVTAYDEGTPWTVPIPRRPVHDFLESSAAWLPKRTATVFYGSELSYRRLNRKTNQFAHVLHGLGVKPGDRVMIVLPNMPQFIMAYYAILRNGGVVVLPNPDANARHIIRLARNTGATILVTLGAFSPMAETVRQLTDVRHVLTADISKVVSSSVYKQLLDRWGVTDLVNDLPEPEESGIRTAGVAISDLMRDAPLEFKTISTSSDSVATIAFTSGTTSRPKGVCLTHGNLVANAIQARHWIANLRYGKETILSVIPFLHSYGMTTGMNMPITMGATMVILPVFELQQVLEHIRDYKPSMFPGVPSMYAAINQAPRVREYGLSAVQVCISGAAPLPIEVKEAFEKLTHGRLAEGYGLTEATMVTHANPLFSGQKTGSIGVPLPNTDAKIVDLASGEELPPGQIGELVVRGPQVMKGYWNLEEETAAALKDGWLHTGDVALRDEEGYFQIIGRMRDTIIAGDFSVYPRDVEEVLYENSKVQEVAVVGVPHTESGQKVKAFVVPRPGTNLTKEELMALCRKRLDEYAVPWEIEFREELPKSFIGKVIRRMLVEE
ncbi:MAG: alpha/beta fold hydrolase [Candidatus Promineifilaceae bacterium]